jgi:hypothetical protein
MTIDEVVLRRALATLPGGHEMHEFAEVRLNDVSDLIVVWCVCGAAIRVSRYLYLCLSHGSFVGPGWPAPPSSGA